MWWGVVHHSPMSTTQAEIKRLKEVHKIASKERKLLLLQQKDIARMKRQTEYYQGKAKQLSDSQHSPSPSNLSRSSSYQVRRTLAATELL